MNVKSFFPVCKDQHTTYASIFEKVSISKDVTISRKVASETVEKVSISQKVASKTAETVTSIEKGTQKAFSQTVPCRQY